jgi:hypothetical protein
VAIPTVNFRSSTTALHNHVGYAEAMLPAALRRSTVIPRGQRTMTHVRSSYIKDLSWCWEAPLFLVGILSSTRLSVLLFRLPTLSLSA